MSPSSVADGGRPGSRASGRPSPAASCATRSLSILLAGGLLVALAIPALQMKSVTSDVDQLPQDLPIIQTYDKVKADFPSEGVTATVVVEADDVRSGAAAAGIAALAAQVAESDSFLPGGEVVVSDDGTRRPDRHPHPRHRHGRRVDEGAGRAARGHRPGHDRGRRGRHGQRQR